MRYRTKDRLSKTLFYGGITLGVATVIFSSNITQRFGPGGILGLALASFGGSITGSFLKEGLRTELYRRISEENKGNIYDEPLTMNYAISVLDFADVSGQTYSDVIATYKQVFLLPDGEIKTQDLTEWSDEMLKNWKD